MRLRIGHLSTLYHTSILMMAKPEFLKGFKAGADWRLFGTGPAIVKAFDEGALDMAYIGLPPAVIGIAGGLPLKCIAGGHMEGTVVASRNYSHAWPTETDIGRIFSECKIIGVPGTGSIHDLIIKDTVEKYGLKAMIRNFPWADQVLEAFVKREVDTVCGTPALAQAVRQFADGAIICPPSLLWPGNPSYGIVIKEPLLKERGMLSDFLAVHEEASRFLRGHRAEAARLIPAYMGVVDEEFAAGALSISPKYCAALSPLYVDCTMRLSDRQLELGYISRPVKMEEVFDFEIIREVHPEPDHYSLT